MVRCFVGVLAPEEIKPAIEDVQEELSRLPIKCKFVEKENLHICFSFLGEIADDNVGKITEALDLIANEFNSFEVFVDGIKAIPNENYFRVLVLDVIGKDENLKNLAEEIKNKIGGDSKPVHLTLCRVKNIDNKKMVIEKMEEMKRTKIGSMKIKSIQLIKSELKRTGPEYSIAHESKFKE